MTWEAWIVHVKGEEKYAEKLARPLRRAGYKVSHEGTIFVGDSVIGETSNILNTGGPIVVCGTKATLGSTLTLKLVNAARSSPKVRVFTVQMEEDANIDIVGFGGKIAAYWENPKQALDQLLAALKRYYPLSAGRKPGPHTSRAERKYRELTLESSNIIDLANLPKNDLSFTNAHPELRWLYVQQRVRVETASPVEVGQGLFEALKNTMQREDEISIGSRLTESQRLVILGEPGSGKTTLLRWLATVYLLRLERSPDRLAIPGETSLPGKNWLPLMIRCRDLDKSALNGSLKDMLAQALSRLEIVNAKTAATAFLNKFEQNRALLLIDGLDEITNPTSRIRFCQQLERISRRFKKTPIIVTSRLVGYKEMRYRMSNFEHFTLSDFSKEDKDRFVRQWCDLFELPDRRKTVANELIKYIHSTERLEHLTGNPMLLTAMALVKRRFGKPRIRKAELYWDLLEVLLYWRSDVGEPLEESEVIPQLEYLAYEMCDRGAQRLLRDETLLLLENMRREYPRIHAVSRHTPEDFLDLLVERMGILVVTGQVRSRGMSVAVYEFRHPIFREYLAARALVDGRFPRRNRQLSLASNVARLAGHTNPIQLPRSRAREVAIIESWREVLRLCIASCRDDDVDKALLAILRPLKGENSAMTARPRAVLSALCLADEPNVKDNVARHVLRTFVRQIDLNDGKHYGTSVDSAILELATSRWAERLQDLMDQERAERKRRVDPSADNLASLGAMLGTAMIG